MAGKHQRTSERRQGVKLTPEERAEKQSRFLAAYKSSGNIRASCLAAKIDRQTVRYWQEHDLTFSFEFQEAIQDVDDLIDAEITRRSLHGEKEPIVSMGKVLRDENGEILYLHRKSDTLLMFLAKSRMKKYRDKQEVEMSGKDGKPIEVVDVTKDTLKHKLDAIKASLLSQASQQQDLS